VKVVIQPRGTGGGSRGPTGPAGSTGETGETGETGTVSEPFLINQAAVLIQNQKLFANLRKESQ
jgi:hypothetical protein